jgi:hypothetical protein
MGKMAPAVKSLDSDSKGAARKLAEDNRRRHDNGSAEIKGRFNTG